MTAVWAKYLGRDANGELPNIMGIPARDLTTEDYAELSVEARALVEMTPRAYRITPKAAERVAEVVMMAPKTVERGLDVIPPKAVELAKVAEPPTPGSSLPIPRGGSQK